MADGEKVGIKETREVIEAIGKVGAVIAKHLKDGFQTSDAVVIATELATKPDVQAAIKAASDNIKAVPQEIKNVDLLEGLDLAVAGIAVSREIIKALSGA